LPKAGSIYKIKYRRRKRTVALFISIFQFSLGVSLFTAWFYSDQKVWALFWASLWLIGIGFAEFIVALIKLE
jgi:hypothetical protein